MVTDLYSDKNNKRGALERKGGLACAGVNIYALTDSAEYITNNINIINKSEVK